MAFSFGTPSTAKATPASTGFSFGGAATPAPQPTTTPASTGFSFGGAATPAPQPAATGFSFAGAGTTDSANKNKRSVSFAPTTAGGTGTGFSFGSTAPSTATPALGGFGLNTPASTTPAPSSSLFSTGFGSTPVPATGGTSAFGSSFNTAPGTMMMGAPQQQQQSSSLNFDTKFEHLPPAMKQEIETFGKFLGDQNQLESTIHSVSVQKLTELKQTTGELQQFVIQLRNMQDRECNGMKAMKNQVKEVIRGGEVASHNVHCLKSDGRIQREIELPSRFYWTLLQNFEARFVSTQKQIGEIETQLRPFSSSTDLTKSSRNDPQMTPQLVQNILRSHNEAFMRIAALVAQTHELMDELRQEYLKMLQQDHENHGGNGNVRNPFEAADRLEADEERRAMDKIKLTTTNQSTSPLVNTQPTSNAATGAPFGTPAPPSTTSGLFGGTAGFGTPGKSTTSAFGTPVGTSGLFGSTTPSALGMPNTLGTTPTANAFGSTTGSAFGTPATSTAPFSTGFGSAAPASGTLGATPSLFGGASTTSSSFSTSSKNKGRRSKLKKK